MDQGAPSLNAKNANNSKLEGFHPTQYCIPHCVIGRGKHRLGKFIKVGNGKRSILWEKVDYIYVTRIYIVYM